MRNPFINRGNLCSNVSINKLLIQKMPTDKVTQNLQGKSALDIFSTELFIREIKKHSRELKLNLSELEEKKLPQYLGKCLESSDSDVRNEAQNIVRSFGERFGVILLTLKKGEKENRLKRNDWNDEHWDYWKDGIKNIILVGGLSSSILGKNLKHYAEKVFIDVNEEPYNIILTSDSSNAGIRGCTEYINEKKEGLKYLILDCGQTFIKRSYVTFTKEKILNINKLDKVPSKYVTWEFENVDDEKKEAVLLSEYLLGTIQSTIRTLDESADSVGEDIVISIANYVRHGLFADRGGYGKLKLVTDDYEKYLSYKLYDKFKRKFKITLVHDGTAMAAAFCNYQDSVCISLGTAFGVGFPERLDK